MKLVQKILSHGLLIAFFVAVFFLYLYRQSLFPQWFDTESQSVAQQTESEQQEQLTLRQEPTAPATPAAPARPAPQQTVEPGDDNSVGGPADLPPLASAGEPALTDDSLPPVADAAATVPVASPDDTGLSQAAGGRAAPEDPASDLPPTVGAATARADAGMGVPPEYQAPERAARDDAATPPDSSQRDTGVGASATPQPPQYRPVESPASGEPAAVDIARQAAPPGVDEQPLAEPPGPAPSQVPPDAMQAAASQAAASAGQVAPGTTDRAPPQYRPLQQPRRYPSAPDMAPQAPQRGEAAPISPPPSPVSTIASAPTSAGAQSAAGADDGFRTAIAQAREVFWSRDMRGALEAYRSLVETYPEQADGWGELGNLYLTLGQRSVAADAYYQAIGLLIDQGEAIRARHLLRMLHGLDSGKASELEQRLRQVGS